MTERNSNIASKAKTDNPLLPLAKSTNSDKSHSLDIIFPNSSRITEDLLANLPQSLKTAVKLQEAIKAVLSPENYSLICYLYKEINSLSPYGKLSESSVNIVQRLSSLFTATGERIPPGNLQETYPLAHLLQKTVLAFNELQHNIKNFHSNLPTHEFVPRDQYIQKRKEKLDALQLASNRFMIPYTELDQAGFRV